MNPSENSDSIQTGGLKARLLDEKEGNVVLKPFANERTLKTSNLAFHRTESEREAQLTKILCRLETLLSKSPRIAVKTKGRILLVDPGDIVVVEAKGKRVALQWHSETYLLRDSISAIADKLKPYGFVRIHRSVVVNSSFVEEIRPRNTGEYRLSIKGGKEYTVSRTYKSNLRSVAQSWFGVEGAAALPV